MEANALMFSAVLFFVTVKMKNDAEIKTLNAIASPNREEFEAVKIDPAEKRNNTAANIDALFAHTELGVNCVSILALGINIKALMHQSEPIT